MQERLTAQPLQEAVLAEIVSARHLRPKCRIYIPGNALPRSQLPVHEGLGITKRACNCAHNRVACHDCDSSDLR